MSSDGSDQVNITEDLAEDFDPAWSPDGSRIVFSRSTGAHFHVYVMDADGSNVQQLTDVEYNDAYVTWSPDGKKIAFTRFDEEGSGDVFTRDSAPAWSPDGDRIAFRSFRAARATPRSSRWTQTGAAR
jgi:TolB protein